MVKVAFLQYSTSYHVKKCVREYRVVFVKIVKICPVNITIRNCNYRDNNIKHPNCSKSSNLIFPLEQPRMKMSCWWTEINLTNLWNLTSLPCWPVGHTASTQHPVSPCIWVKPNDCSKVGVAIGWNCALQRKGGTDEELGLFLCMNSSIEEGYCTDISLGSSVFFETLFSIF